MKPNPVILLIDADKPTRKLLQMVLEVQRYRVFEAETGETGIKEAVARRHDAHVPRDGFDDERGNAPAIIRCKPFDRLEIVVARKQRVGGGRGRHATGGRGRRAFRHW